MSRTTQSKEYYLSFFLRIESCDLIHQNSPPKRAETYIFPVLRYFVKQYKLYFFEEPTKTGEPKQIIFSVKAGKVQVSHIRDLRGVVDREKAAIGVLICLEEPTQPMRTEAASADFYKPIGVEGKSYPKIQMLTIADILNGKNIDCPPYIGHGGNVTFKRATEKQIEKKKKPQASLIKFDRDN